MKRPNLFQRALACLIAFAITQVTLQAATPTINLITSFIIPEPGVDTNPADINNDGTIVGGSDFGDLHVEGFVRFRNGDYSVIIDPNDDGHYTTAAAINNSGLIAGYYYSGSSYHGFFLSGDTYTDFTVSGACDTKITALNDAGDFAGQVYVPGSGGCNEPDLESFVSIGGNVTIFTIPGAIFTIARGMNNLGQVVGSYYENGGHGFFRDADGTLTLSIDYPGAVATALTGINDKGWMVGNYDDTEGSFHALFLQSPTEFVVFDVGQSDFTFFEGINNRGFICGSYSDGSPLVAIGFLARVRRSSDN